MSVNRKSVVAVIFGGRSVEHDVSIITGHQIIRAFNKERYDIIPVYISRQGYWYTGEPLLEIENFKNGNIADHKDVSSAILSPSVQHHGLIINPMAGRLQRSQVKRLDVAFPAVHGSHGEDGTLQGLFELADIPYVGCGVIGSALANDKILAKSILKQADIPIIDGTFVYRSDWIDNRQEILKMILDQLQLPLFIKPATLGSSIGVGRAEDIQTLELSLDIAANFDGRVIVESAIVDTVEINCAVMGYGNDIEASVLEQPISWEQFLTYEEKYMRGEGGMKSQERLIPAPMSEDLTKRVQQYAIDSFKAIDGHGIARIDFLLTTENGQINNNSKIYINEINTMPGSLALYLWHNTGFSQTEIVERLINIAKMAYTEKRRNTYDYHTDLVALTAERGLKGAKSYK